MSSLKPNIVTSFDRLRPFSNIFGAHVPSHEA